jgi:hypothetical protein
MHVLKQIMEISWGIDSKKYLSIGGQDLIGEPLMVCPENYTQTASCIENYIYIKIDLSLR